jgi:hypothetical protein
MHQQEIVRIDLLPIIRTTRAESGSRSVTPSSMVSPISRSGPRWRERPPLELESVVIAANLPETKAFVKTPRRMIGDDP